LRDMVGRYRVLHQSYTGHLDEVIAL
jgi:hypothetical protein